MGDANKMSANFNVRPFGFNVILPSGTEQAAKSVESAVGSLLDPVLDYLKENEGVFSGDIASEINKLNFQTMKLGMTMEQGKEVHNLDTKF